MKRTALLVLAGCAGATSRPAVLDPAAARDQVRNAEIAFATAFRDRDRDRFFSYLAEDAVFLGPQKTLRGRDAVIATWSRFFEAPTPPFSWRPARVEASLDGSLGLSSGPIFDPAGKPIGMYSSVWRRQPDGGWTVVFDGPGCSAPAPCPPCAAPAP